MAGAAAAPWGKGCCSPLSPEMGKPDVGGDVRDGAVAVRDPVVAGHPMGRVGMLPAHPPALSNSGGMGEREGGEQISPATEGSGLCPAPFQAKYSGKGRAGAAHPRSSPFWLEKAVSTRFILPDGRERLAAAAFLGLILLPLWKCRVPRLPRREQKQPSEETAPDSPFPRRADKRRAAGRRSRGRWGWEIGRAGREGLELGTASWEKAACSSVEARREQGWQWLSPPAPWEGQGWVPGVLLWFPWPGSSFGAVLSYQCQVSSWLGVSSLSRGRPVSASPAHRGHKHPRGQQGMVPALPLPRHRGWEYPRHPSPASSPSRT